jgi:hypothetical protein
MAGTNDAMTNEATTQYLEKVRDDCASVLGSGIPVLSIEQVDAAGGVGLRVRFEAHGTVHEMSAIGDTVVAAHAALRLELVRVRLSVGFTSLAGGE